MLYIAHRVNTIEALLAVRTTFGVECDLRDHGSRLVLRHDAFGDGVDFEDWLAHYRHRFLIANIKCEGIEAAVLEYLARHQVQDFFLLDLSFPALIKLARQGERRMAVRYSEYESIEFALALAGKVQWCWIDCFTQLPLTPTSYRRLREAFQLCVVSPELQGHAVDTIAQYQTVLRAMPVDAVCTKHPLHWGVA